MEKVKSRHLCCMLKKQCKNIFGKPITCPKYLNQFIAHYRVEREECCLWKNHSLTHLQKSSIILNLRSTKMQNLTILALKDMGSHIRKSKKTFLLLDLFSVNKINVTRLFLHYN